MADIERRKKKRPRELVPALLPILARLREIAEKIDSPNADRVYVAKEYTKGDLRRDLLAIAEEM